MASDLSPRPSFDKLPLKADDPPFSAWGLYGHDDQLGALNMLTPAITKAAAAEIKQGIAVPLGLPLKMPIRPMNPARKPCVHSINAKGVANDDRLDFDTQGSSHWDGLRHYPFQSRPHEGRYYNGVTQSSISGQDPDHKIGIHHAARHGTAHSLDTNSSPQSPGLVRVVRYFGTNQIAIIS